MMAAKTVKTRSPLWAEMISRMESMFVRYQTDQGWAPVLISFASETPPGNSEPAPLPSGKAASLDPGTRSRGGDLRGLERRAALLFSITLYRRKPLVSPCSVRRRESS